MKNLDEEVIWEVGLIKGKKVLIQRAKMAIERVYSKTRLKLTYKYLSPPFYIPSLLPANSERFRSFEWDQSVDNI